MKWLIDLILSFLGQKNPKVKENTTIAVKKETSEHKKVLKPQVVVENEPWENVNWAMPDGKLSKYFTVKEALWLNSWSKMALPDAEQRENIYRMALKMDEIRAFLGVPLHVTSWLRPEEYNAFIGGAKRSHHMKGLAVDFVSRRMTAEAMRQKLLPKLEELGIRMEDNKHIGKGNWVHVDLGDVISKRFFKP